MREILVGYDLREVLFQGRGWERFGVELLKELVALENLSFLFVVEDIDNAIARYPFLVGRRSDFVETSIDRSLDSTRTYLDELDQCDIYHSLTEFPEFNTRNARTLVTIHDLSFFVCPEKIDNKFAMAASTTLDWVLENSDGIVLMSEWVSSCLVRYAKSRSIEIKIPVHKVSYGVDHFSDVKPDNISPDLQARPYFLYTGGFEKDKNCELILEAYMSDEMLRNEFQLLMVGRNPDLIRKKIDALINPDVILLEDTSDQDLVGLYKNAYCFITASQDEGIGICPIEAAYYGIPVICPDIPVFRETLGDYAIYYEPNSKAELACSIRRLIDLKRKKEITRMGDKFDFTSRTWKRSAFEIRELYLRLLD